MEREEEEKEEEGKRKTEGGRDGKVKGMPKGEKRERGRSEISGEGKQRERRKRRGGGGQMIRLVLMESH